MTARMPRERADGPTGAAVVHAIRHALDRCLEEPAGDPTRDIPALRDADSDAVGIAWAPTTGEARCLGGGDWDRPFSLQSVSKVFALVLLLARDRGDVWELFATPGNEDYRSAAALDPREGRAPNPFTNAGALVVVDRLMEQHGDVAAAVRDLVAGEADQAPRGTTSVDEAVAASELSACHRNRGLAHLLAERGLLHHPVEAVLEQYVRQCAVAATCGAVASAARVLARGGRRRDDRVLLAPLQARRVNALMLTSGAYGDSGAYAMQVGLPLKTGVGGGVLAVVPGRGALCAWSPGLDAAGTPRRALAAVSHVAQACGLSVF